MDRILIIEDEKDVNRLLAQALHDNGYKTVSVYNGLDVVNILKEGQFEMVLLDLMLPYKSGDEVLKDIRKVSDIPVIIISAKDMVSTKVDLLAAGADDYITKPFDIKEVLARIEVQIRRTEGLIEEGKMSYQGMELDKTNYCVRVEGTELSKITRQEFSILELFLRHPKKVFSKEEIFEYAWEEPYMGETKTLDVHISNIRKKIKEVTEKEYIETVWGIGYRLHP